MTLSPTVAACLADAVLALHAGIAAWVVLMTLAVPLGGARGWRWTRRRTLRWLHVVLVLVIAAQAWLGRLCPLTTWEQQLRAHAGQSAYATSFVEHWLSRLLFLELPWWVFVAAYTAIAALTALGWWRWPPAAPTRRPGRPPAFGE